MCVQPRYIVPYRLEDGSVSYRYGAPVGRTEPIIDFESGEVFEAIPIGCGKCLECINLHKLQWTHRLMDELSCHKLAMFLTLTYRPGSTFDGDLHPEHLTLFLKRLRKSIEPQKIRYFLCGEYGSKGRPHYHVIIFGYLFPDAQPFRRDKKGFMMCRSPTLEKLWPYGFSSILPANETTFGYVTKDMQKLRPLEKGRRKPFLRMSTHPGIGAAGWNRSLSDGLLWHAGKSCPLPRYYKKLAEREGLPGLLEMQKKTVIFAQQSAELRDPEEKLRRNAKKLKKLFT